MIKNYQELTLEIDTLKGNINRMCVTDDIKELYKRYDYIKVNLKKIYQYNINRFEKEI